MTMKITSKVFIPERQLPNVPLFVYMLAEERHLGDITAVYTDKSHAKLTGSYVTGFIAFLIVCAGLGMLSTSGLAPFLVLGLGIIGFISCIVQAAQYFSAEN